MEERLIVSQADNAGVPIVRVEGRLIATTLTQLETVILGYLRLSRSSIVLDVRELTYLASPGLHLLTSMRDQCAANHGVLILVHPQGRVRETLDLTGLLSTFEVQQDIDQAVLFIQARSSG